MTYRIIHKGKVIKEYPHRLTCVIWLMLKGLVYEHWRFGKWIDPDYEIKEEECLNGSL